MSQRPWWLGKPFLPRAIECSGAFDGYETLYRAGVRFHGPAEGNGELQHVSLPQGWKTTSAPFKLPKSFEALEEVTLSDSDHWILQDHRGRERAKIYESQESGLVGHTVGYTVGQRCFAVMVLSPRFAVAINLTALNKRGTVVYDVLDCDKIIHTTSPPILLMMSDEEEKQRAVCHVRGQAVDWLDSQYPNWMDPGAHWDDD